MREERIKNTKTLAWELYELGRNYNQQLVPNQYNVVETNTEFFIGNQWLRLPNTPAMAGLAKPVFNILKRVANMFIASLTSSGVAIHFDPLAYYDGSNVADPEHDAARFANAEVEALLEKFKFDYRIRDALFQGAQTGDYCAHFWFDPDKRPYGGAFEPYRGEIQMELVEGINVMFGNPNDHRIQEQPYVLIVGRDTTEHLRWEAERFQQWHKTDKNGKPNEQKDPGLLASEFQPDYENEYMPGIGGKTELVDSGQGTGKELFVYLYTKVTKEEDVTDADGNVVYEDETGANGDPVLEQDDDGAPILDPEGMPVVKQKPLKQLKTTVHVTKATRTAIIYEDVDTGLELYPIAWGVWERQTNQYHGRALVTGLIPNQIFINSMFATAFRHAQLTAFPKTVYNADLISSWNNEVGQAIAIHGLQPGMGISQVAQNLQPGDMSNQIFTLIDKAMAYTKECLGATDVQMGNVRPDNTSAIMVLQTNAEVPLENIRANLYEWVEDIGQILLDMMGTYYGERPVVVPREFEDPVMGPAGIPQIDQTTGQMVTRKVIRNAVEYFDFSQFKHLWLNLRADVGATTYYSEIAMTQTLDNLRRDGTLDILQYLERLPDKLIPKKQELIDEIRSRVMAGTQANAAAGSAIPEPGTPVSQSPGQGVEPVQGGQLDADKAVQGLPTQAEVGFDELPNIAKKTALAQGALRAE